MTLTIPTGRSWHETSAAGEGKHHCEQSYDKDRGGASKSRGPICELMNYCDIIIMQVYDLIVNLLLHACCCCHCNACKHLFLMWVYV